MTQHDRAASSRRPMAGHHGPHRMMPGEKAADFKGTMKKMLALMGSFKFALGAVAPRCFRPPRPNCSRA